jgi:hypothetical protein
MHGPRKWRRGVRYGHRGHEQNIALITSFVVVERDGPETARIPLAIFSEPQVNIADAIGARVDSENDRWFVLVVKGTKGRRVQDSDFESSKRSQLRRSYFKGFVLPSEVDERMSNQSITLDENA